MAAYKKAKANKNFKAYVKTVRKLVGKKIKEVEIAPYFNTRYDEKVAANEIRKAIKGKSASELAVYIESVDEAILWADGSDKPVKTGQRVKADQDYPTKDMDNKDVEIKKGTKGKVSYINSQGEIHIKWANGKETHDMMNSEYTDYVIRESEDDGSDFSGALDEFARPKGATKGSAVFILHSQGEKEYEVAYSVTGDPRLGAQIMKGRLNKAEAEKLGKRLAEKWDVPLRNFVRKGKWPKITYVLQTESVDESVKSLLKDWKKIKTVSDLKSTIKSVAAELRKTGKGDLADKFEARLKKIPAKMDKEAINYVLMALSKEVGLIESEDLDEGRMQSVSLSGSFDVADVKAAIAALTSGARLWKDEDGYHFNVRKTSAYPKLLKRLKELGAKVKETEFVAEGLDEYKPGSPLDVAEKREAALVAGIKAFAKKYKLGPIEKAKLRIDARGQITLLQKMSGPASYVQDAEIPDAVKQRVALAVDGAKKTFLKGQNEMSGRWITLNHFGWEKLLRAEKLLKESEEDLDEGDIFRGVWPPKDFPKAKKALMSKAMLRKVIQSRSNPAMAWSDLYTNKAEENMRRYLHGYLMKTYGRSPGDALEFLKKFTDAEIKEMTATARKAFGPKGPKESVEDDRSDFSESPAKQIEDLLGLDWMDEDYDLGALLEGHGGEMAHFSATFDVPLESIPEIAALMEIDSNPNTIASFAKKNKGHFTVYSDLGQGRGANKDKLVLSSGKYRNNKTKEVGKEDKEKAEQLAATIKKKFNVATSARVSNGYAYVNISVLKRPGGGGTGYAAESVDEASTEEKAKEVANNRSALAKRLADAKAVLTREVQKEFGKGKLDFANKRLVSDGGDMALQWVLRTQPEEPVGPKNQQTNRGPASASTRRRR
jgi:hypothetical protein